jgi:hypothetical protein
MAIPRNLANLANQLNADGDVPKIEVGNTNVTVTDTGSNGTIAFTTEGSERMRVSSAGNVGIGTTTPTVSLEIFDDTNAARIRLSRDAGSSRGLVQFGRNNSGSFQLTSEIQATSDTTSINNGSIFFSNTNSTGTLVERARITKEGYFKATDSSYRDITGTYHEFTQSANDRNVIIFGTNASLSNPQLFLDATRAANTAYSFLKCDSGALADTEFLLRGDGNAFADGTWSNNGADYAEFFESANGQALTLGATVVLDGNKVREATEQDPASAVIGVVRPKEPSKASMVIGNTAWNKWANKYLTDDFDRYIMEDHDVVEWTDEEGKQHSYESHRIPEGITVPADATIKTHDDKGNKFQHYKLNPAWDKDAEYVNRENRPEWNIVGLLGQVKILKGQPVGDRWIKMRDVSDTVEEWFIR